MICGRGGKLLVCEHGMQPSDTFAQCSRVAHARCVGILTPPHTFVCQLHPGSSCSSEVQRKIDVKKAATGVKLPCISQLEVSIILKATLMKAGVTFFPDGREVQFNRTKHQGNV